MKNDVYNSRTNPSTATLGDDVDYAIISPDHAFNIDEIEVSFPRVITGK